MKSVKDRELETSLLKVLVLGDYGTGKSVFASSFPQPGYVFDFDNGMVTYEGGDWLYDTFAATAAGWVAFEKALPEVEKEIKAGNIKTVVVDSLTSLGDCAMERAMQLDPKRSVEGGPIWNVHYQIQKNLVAPKIRRILSYPCNIVITGHWKVQQDAQTGSISSIDLLIVGDLSAKVPGYFDEVYAAGTTGMGSNLRYILRTAPYGLYKARSRYSGVMKLLPQVVPNNYNHIMTLIKEAREKVKETKAATN